MRNYVKLVACVLFAVILLSACNKPIIGSPFKTIKPSPSSNTSPATPKDSKIKEIDLSFIKKDGYTITYSQYADDNTLLFYTTKSSAENESDFSTRIYPYDLKSSGFSDKILDIGRINSPPKGIYADGTVSAITVDPETFTPVTIEFIDFRNLASQSVGIPQGLNIWNIAVSKDKAYLSYTKDDGTYLCRGAGFNDPEYILPLQKGNDPGGMEDILPNIIGWSPNGNYIAYYLTGWEWTKGAGIYDLKTKKTTNFPKLAEMGVSFVNDSTLFYLSNYTVLPAGFYDMNKGTMKTVLKSIKLDNPNDNIDNLSLSGDGKYLCAYYSEHDPSGMLKYMTADVYATTDGKLTDRYRIDKGISEYNGIDEAIFSPDSKSLLLSTSNTETEAKRVLTWEFTE